MGRSVPPMTPDDIRLVQSLIANEINPHQIRSKVLTYFQSKFRGMPQFSRDALDQEAALQISNYATDAGKNLLQKLRVSHLSTDRICEDLVEYLSIDRFYAFPFTTSQMEVMGARYHLDIVQCLALNANVSQFRGIVRAFEHLHRSGDALRISAAALNLPIDVTRRDLVARQRSLQIDAQGDVVDTELVHFANVCFSQGDRRRVCLCITKDPPAKIKNRVALMRIFLRNVKFALRGTPIKLPKIKSGAVAFVNDSGQITEVARVRDMQTFHD